MGGVGGGGRQGLVVELLSQEERKLAKDFVLDYAWMSKETLMRVAANHDGQRMGRECLLSSQTSSWVGHDSNYSAECAYLELLVAACKRWCVSGAVLNSATLSLHLIIAKSAIGPAPQPHTVEHILIERF